MEAPGFGGLSPTRGTRRSLISLTPLIDVVFILLVFFMLASSFLDWRSIELDTPGSSRAGTPLEGALLVEVRPDGLRLSGVTMSQQDLNRRLAELTAANQERRVLIKPVAGVAMQNLVAVLDSLAAAGIKDLSLIADSGR